MSRPIRVARIMGKRLEGGVDCFSMNFDCGQMRFDFLVDADFALVPKEEIKFLDGRAFRIPPYQYTATYEREAERLFRIGCWVVVDSCVNELSTFPFCATKRARVRVRIAHLHSGAGKGDIAKSSAKAILKLFSRVFFTHRMACSRYAGEWLSVKGMKFKIVCNAIDLSHLPFDAGVRAQMRANLGLVDGQTTIRHMGRFSASKNHVIETFAELAGWRLGAVLLFVSSDEAEVLARSLVVERGIADSVKFLGKRDGVGRLYQTFDAFALPSLNEGLRLVGVGAQVSGPPCFLSDWSTREVDATDMMGFLSIGDPRVWSDAFCGVELVVRLLARSGDFESCDINRTAERFAARYLDLLVVARCG